MQNNEKLSCKKYPEYLSHWYFFTLRKPNMKLKYFSQFTFSGIFLMLYKTTNQSFWSFSRGIEKIVGMFWNWSQLASTPSKFFKILICFFISTKSDNVIWNPRPWKKKKIVGSQLLTLYLQWRNKFNQNK